MPDFVYTRLCITFKLSAPFIVLRQKIALVDFNEINFFFFLKTLTLFNFKQKK